MKKCHYFYQHTMHKLCKNNTPDFVVQTKQQGSLNKGRNLSTKEEWTR